MEDKDYISKVHAALTDNLEGFSKDEATFRKEIQNPEYAAKVHKALSENLDGFDKSPDEFYKLLSATSQPGEAKKKWGKLIRRVEYSFFGIVFAREDEYTAL